MKMIIAVIRNERVGATKAALREAGIRGITFAHVTGRGLQKGRISTREIGDALNRNMRMQLMKAPKDEASRTDPVGVPENYLSLNFLPKRMLLIVTDDNEISAAVQAIVNTNQTGQHGDGRIFICPMISAIRVRTGEQGTSALS
jgi:nitrogen regulatory protein PII 2